MLHIPLDILSRSEGIETCYRRVGNTRLCPLDILSRSEGIETPARVLLDVRWDSWLWIYFPVRRELKHRNR